MMCEQEKIHLAKLSTLFLTFHYIYQLLEQSDQGA